jgi:transcription antitermination factor NusG
MGIVSEAAKHLPTFEEQVDGARKYRQEIVDEYLRGVWHDSNKEQPKKGETVVIWDGCYGEILTRIVCVHPDRKWAYLYDLFKEG